ncbi:FMN-binding protein [Arthrobacter livingstonensis]|uniref:FMN-binding protein n=1 Tax=Arthrobacter livingstonensis TaxID=670078 RepID=A0A2V5L488_9MICC|nr:FMN-binding protein [Arthrobacter livingstonensis]PYI64523.1 FMN-binding protein [Arthrobacter livingstonensis]
MNGKWRGTALFLGIFAVMGATFGLRLYSAAPQTAIAASLTQTPHTPATKGSAAAPATIGGAAVPAAKPATAPSAAKTTTGSGAATAVTNITGDPENTPYGNVQVAVSFSGKKITGVTVLQVPNSGNYDQQVAQVVPPTLRQEVLSSQSANVNTVSGGTYTSTGYLQSVQSAIDKLP